MPQYMPSSLWLVISVARPRHKHVLGTTQRRLFRLGLPALAVLAVGTPAVAVVWSGEERVGAAPMTEAALVQIQASPVPMRVAPITRSEPTVQLEEKPVVAAEEFAARLVKVRKETRGKARTLEVLDRLAKAAGPGRSEDARAQAESGSEPRSVRRVDAATPEQEAEPAPTPTTTPATEPTPAATATTPKPEPTTAATPKADASTPEAEPTPTPGYEAAPVAPETSGLSSAPCASGSEVESTLTAEAIAVHRAVCAAFPEVDGYAGLGPGHSGGGLDIMVTGPAGDEVATWVRTNASELGVSAVAWSEWVWTVERDGEGWRWVEDDTSTTADHYDHVHVTVP